MFTSILSVESVQIYYNHVLLPLSE